MTENSTTSEYPCLHSNLDLLRGIARQESKSLLGQKGRPLLRWDLQLIRGMMLAFFSNFPYKKLDSALGVTLLYYMHMGGY
jgi:hypothetical protein